MPASHAAILLLLGAAALHAQPTAEDAAAIMAKVAANVEKAAAARRLYVYQQKVRSRLIRTNGQTAREEERRYSVFPTEKITEKKLDSFLGKYHKNRREIVTYSGPGFRSKGMDLDGELIEDLTGDLVDDKNSRDGIPHSLFPLGAKDLPGYRFALKETLVVHGRSTHRIAFEPATKPNCLNLDVDGGGGCKSPPWKGEALIDAEEHQPVSIHTDLAFKMPKLIRFVFGTNLRQTGFSISYRRLAANVWFPVSYGAEFRLDVLFGYRRVITMALESSGFQKTEATSRIDFVE